MLLEVDITLRYPW